MGFSNATSAAAFASPQWARRCSIRWWPTSRRDLWLFEVHLRVVCDLLKLQVARRIRLASFEFDIALLSLEPSVLDGPMADRARLPRLTISAATGKRLPRVAEPKSQRN